MKFFRFLTLLTVFLFAGPASTSAAELFMVEDDFCPFCKKFHKEIGPAYPKTEEGMRAPLRTIQLGDAFPEPYGHISPARVTPTFILVHNNREIDRLIGYPGDEYFWFLLSEMLAKLEQPDASEAKP